MKNINKNNSYRVESKLKQRLLHVCDTPTIFCL